MGGCVKNLVTLKAWAVYHPMLCRRGLPARVSLKTDCEEWARDQARLSVEVCHCWVLAQPLLREVVTPCPLPSGGFQHGSGWQQLWLFKLGPVLTCCCSLSDSVSQTFTIQTEALIFLNPLSHPIEILLISIVLNLCINFGNLKLSFNKILKC